MYCTASGNTRAHRLRQISTEVSWHFTASKAQAAQFSEFQTTSVIATAASHAPLLWDLLDMLFCVDSDPPSEKTTAEEIQFKRDVVSVSNCFF